MTKVRMNMLYDIGKMYKSIHGVITKYIQMEVIARLEHIIRRPPTIGMYSPDRCEMAGTHDAAHRDNGGLASAVHICPRDAVEATPGFGAIEKRCEPLDVHKVGVALPPSLAQLFKMGREGEDDPSLCNATIYVIIV